ncbi:uncharacterized protein LOC119307699 isoform X8 [Triticum dicoccoides]|uniref:uncharacterized protein LOC119307699 isoform X8 n=1 Tax=Triticum dicoccoides TaxID=85692 RepID=UPI00189022D0|nr:uncharacterized protein LOC119307699 isoform X8 [Triticum dicoccoides]
MLCSPTPSFCLFDSVWSRSSCCSRPLVPSFHGCAAARGPPYASPRSYGSRVSCSGDMVCSVWRCLRGSRRCCVSCVAAANGSGRSETGGPCSPTHRRPEWFRFFEGEGGAKGDGSNKSESKRTDSMSCHEEFEAVRRHKSRVLNYVKAMLMCKSLRVTSSMAIIFPPTSFRPWRPGQRSRT